MPKGEKGHRISTKPGKEGISYGRKKKRPENFEEVLRRQRNGKLTLKATLAEFKIGRTRWYDELAREISGQAG